MRIKSVLVAVSMLAACSVQADAITNGVSSGAYHLQGIACDGEAIYWSFTTSLVKTDLTGTNKLAEVEVPMHSGDLCVHRGKVYVATDEGMFVRQNNLKQEIRVYDAATLQRVKIYNIDADCASHGFHVSAIEYANNRFWLAMGRNEDSTDTKNYVMEYTPSFEYVATHELATGNTQYGLQTIAYHDGKFYIGTYSGENVPASAFICDSDSQGFVNSTIPAAEGVMSVNGTLYTAVSSKGSNDRWTAIATSVEGLDRIYSVNGSSGDLVDTPDALLELGFMPKSRYYGGSDGTISGSGTEPNNLIANAVPRGGNVFTLNHGTQAYAGGVAVPSGTLTVPSAEAINAPAVVNGSTTQKSAPVVLSEGTLHFAGGGTLTRDIALFPLAGNNDSGAIIDVSGRAVVTNTGTITSIDGHGNLFKMGAGTFVLATPGGNGVVTNFVGSHGENPGNWKKTLNFAANGDGPTIGNPSFGVFNGRFVIATGPKVVTDLGVDTYIGGPTTQDGVETAGHLDIYSGIVRCSGFVTLGRDNGNATTAPDGLSSTMNLYGGSFYCDTFDMSYNSWYGTPSRIFTCRPVLNIHGGMFDIANIFRIDYTGAHATINVDGGKITMNEFSSAHYAAGGHVEINISNGGEFICKTEFKPVRYSTQDNPSYARVNVSNGGSIAFKTVAHASCSAPDARFFFDGGILKSRQSAANDEIPAYMPIDVGANGMTVDVTGGLYWGLKIRSSIQAKSGVTDGGLRVVNYDGDVDMRWLCFNGGVTLAGGVAVSNAYVCLGGNVAAAVTVEDEKGALRATADVTVNSISYSGASGRFDVAFSGNTGDSGVRAYIVTADAFTPPTGMIMVRTWRTDSTTGSYPSGSFPFLRVPASSSVNASCFYTTGLFRFEDSVADGWRTISLVNDDASTIIDPRSSNDWLSGSGNNWLLGPWLLTYSGTGTSDNFMYGRKGYKQAGGIDVTGSLTLTAGSELYSGPFFKLGSGTLALTGNKTYNFATSLGGGNPKTDGTNWNQFDANGNAYADGYSVPIIVGAGTLVVGTGSDNPQVISTGPYPLWIGCATTANAASELDAYMEVKSGSVYVNGDFFVGRNRPAATAAHEPLIASYVQSGGEVDAAKLFVGYSDSGSGSTYMLQQTFNFTLNGGRFSTLDEARVGTYYGDSGSRGNVATLTVNGGFLEVGTTNGASAQLKIGQYITSSNCSTEFEMNGGEAMLWKGLTSPYGGDSHTQIRLNGGTITFGGTSAPIFTGSSKSDLYWNGTVLKPYQPTYLSTFSTLSGFAVREVGSNGAIIDLSEANVDSWDLNVNLTGSGNIIVRGGDTNRAVRICYAMTGTGEFIAENGGVIQGLHNNYNDVYAGKTVRVRDGGGIAGYYGKPFKKVYLGETASDSTFVYGYGYSGHYAITASDALEVKGTVYCAYRTVEAGIPLHVPAGTNPILKGPKGCFSDVNLSQFKLHPLLAKGGVTASFTLDTSDASSDVIKMTVSAASYYNRGESLRDQPAYPGTVAVDASTPISGTVIYNASTASGGGTVQVAEPLSGNGTIKLTTGRIEGRPEDFDGVTLDLNNASVRFTESGHSTVNLKNSDGGATGLGLEVPEGKTVYVSGMLTNRSALVKMDRGTLVLQNDAAFTLTGNAQKNANSAWVEGSVPVNGDVPYANTLTVNAGTLVLDMPGTVMALNGAAGDSPWVGNHPIPDGNGGALPAVMEIWQGEFSNPNGYMAIGRYNACDYDACSKFTSRPYAAFNQYGGTVRVKGLIMGYSYYKYTQCGLYELNIYDGLFEVGSGYVTIGFEGNSVRINGQDNECVVNVYGGEFRKLAGDGGADDRFMVGGKNSAWPTYIPKMKLNVYDGIVRTASSVLIEVPGSNANSGYLNMYGGVVETKNFKDSSTSSRPAAEGHIRFDGGTFRPLEDNGALSGFSSVTVGAGGGMIDMTNSNTYTVSQLKRATDLGSAEDGGFGASGTGTLVMNVANGYNGPTRVSGTATMKQGVANALSDVVVLDGGTLDLNGIATTFRSIKGHGSIIGDCTVTEALELDGALTVNGDLTLSNGVAMKMEIADNGAALTPLTVTGALTGGSNMTIDFGRYYDRAFLELQAQIGSVGSGSSFSAKADHVAGWNRISGVHCSNGVIILTVQPRGTSLTVR